jgi:hypothetical protein
MRGAWLLEIMCTQDVPFSPLNFQLCFDNSYTVRERRLICRNDGLVGVAFSELS